MASPAQPRRCCSPSPAAAWAARRWPSLRSPAGAGVGLVLVALAWPSCRRSARRCWRSRLCATSERWRLAAAAAVAAAWIVGAFYYQLRLAADDQGDACSSAAGVALGALAWRRRRAARPRADGATAPPCRAAGRGGSARCRSPARHRRDRAARRSSPTSRIWQKEDADRRRPAGVRRARAGRSALADAGRLHARSTSACPTERRRDLRRPARRAAPARRRPARRSAASATLRAPGRGEPLGRRRAAHRAHAEARRLGPGQRRLVVSAKAKPKRWGRGALRRIPRRRERAGAAGRPARRGPREAVSRGARASACLRRVALRVARPRRRASWRAGESAAPPGRC